jgi:hypothetical protein
MSTVRILLIVFVAAAAFAGDLAGLATMRDITSHRASSYDTTGGNTDNVTSFAPGATHVLLDTDGPGRITHMWFTVAPFQGHWNILRDLVLRIYWDRADVPSVEVPLGDFFVLGHGMSYPLQSVPVAVGNDHRALNCYWPMPFHSHARIEIFNNGNRSVRRIYYNLDYELGPQSNDAGLFHALWRREPARLPQPVGPNATGDGNYVILDTQGDGQYVGTALFIDAAPGGWWGEGDEMIFVDGGEPQESSGGSFKSGAQKPDPNPIATPAGLEAVCGRPQQPALHGTGTEDYFGNAWGYKEAFSYPYYGAPLFKEREDGGSWTSVYRWHIVDPIRFHQRLRVTLETNWEEGVTNDVSSVAYWYQQSPITVREPLPGPDAMAPKVHQEPQLPDSMELDGTILEEQLRRQGVVTQGMTVNHGQGYRNGGWLRIEMKGEPITVEIPVAHDTAYSVSIRPVDHALSGPITLQLNGNGPVVFERQSIPQAEVPYIDLGTAEAVDRRIAITIHADGQIGLDAIRIRPVAAATAEPPTPAEPNEP